MTDRRTLLLGGAAAIAFALPVAAPGAVPDAAQAAKRKINIAGRQRMLTQRMAKACCFAHLGVEREAHLDQARAAHALFARSLAGLRHGDPDLGLLREDRGTVIDGLARVRTLWLSYGEAVAAAIASGGRDRAALDAVMARNLGILKEMNATVGLTERAYGGDAIPLHLAIAINIAGRQRMFTQKMSKEAGMIAAGYAPDDARAALAETTRLFQASLDALRHGFAPVGIRAPATAAVTEQLALVAEMWGELATTLAPVAAGGAVDAATLDTGAALNDPLLREMNEAVFLYENES